MADIVDFMAAKRRTETEAEEASKAMGETEADQSRLVMIDLGRFEKAFSDINEKLNGIETEVGPLIAANNKFILTSVYAALTASFLTITPTSTMKL